jgi:hypothetical protein
MPEAHPWDWTNTDRPSLASEERPPIPKRRYRTFTPQFKAQVVLEIFSGQRRASDAARLNQRRPKLISCGKDIVLEGPESLFEVCQRTGDGVGLLLR